MLGKKSNGMDVLVPMDKLIKNKYYRLFFLCMIIFIGLLLLKYQGVSHNTYPGVEKGHIDLGSWDFEEKGILKLDGQWEVYFGQFLSSDDVKKNNNQIKYEMVPGNWSNYAESTMQTFATYRVTIKNLDQDQAYGFKLNRIYLAYKMWINGKLVAESGKIENKNHWAWEKLSPKMAFAAPRDGKIEMIFQVNKYDYYRGGIIESVEIGTQEQIIHNRQNEMIKDSFLAGIILIMSVYHFILFFFRRKELDTLFFGIFGLLAFLETLFEGEMLFSYLFPRMGFWGEETLQTIVIFLMGPVLLTYLYYFFEKKVSLRFLQFSWISGIFFSVLLTIMKFSFLGSIWRLYEPIIIITLGYIFCFLVKHVKQKQKFAMIALAGFSFFAFAGIYDLLVDMEIILSSNILPLGWIVFLFSQIIMIAIKFSNSFHKVESLLQELSVSNEELNKAYTEMEKRVEARTKDLKESEQRYKQLFDAPFEGIILHENGIVLEVNKEICKMIQYEKKELIGKCVFDFIPQKYFEVIKKSMDSGIKQYYEAVMVKKDGTTMDVEILSKSFFFKGKNVRVGAIRDLTERKKSEIALQRNLTFLQVLLDTIPNPIFYKDINGVYRGCNNAYADYLGIKKEHFNGLTVYDVAPKELANIYYKADNELLKNTGKQIYESKLQDAKGVQRDVIFTKATYVDEEGKTAGLVGVVVDITEQKRIQQELRRSSITDHLTQLFNRIKFNEVLDEELLRVKRYHNPLSIIMFDIDHFKKVNDIYGHPVGDEILISISKLIKSMARDTDIVARWGGEEFMILARDTDINGAEVFAERIRRKIEEYNFEKVGKITCSFGVTCFLENDHKETFITRVDNALYEAKNTGRNRVVVY